MNAQPRLFAKCGFRKTASGSFRRPFPGARDGTATIDALSCQAPDGALTHGAGAPPRRARSRGFESMTPHLHRDPIKQGEISAQSEQARIRAARKATGPHWSSPRRDRGGDQRRSKSVRFGLALRVPVSTVMVQHTARRIDDLVSASQVLARSEYVGSGSAERSQRRPRRDRNLVRLRDDQRTAGIENWRRCDIWRGRDLRGRNSGRE
jgi:hypothetical protein